MKNTVLPSLAIALLLNFIPSAFAQEASPAYRMETKLHKGQWEATVNSGAMFSPFGVTANRPTVNYTTTAAQIGYVLNEPSGPGILRGNFEIKGEIFGGGIFNGRGGYVIGSTLWLRYNFLPVGSRWSPFVQAGAGFCFTDVDRRLLGQDFNFNLEAGVGIRYFISSNWSVELEYRYQHLSNANMSYRNIGVNAQGPVAGVSYLF